MRYQDRLLRLCPPGRPNLGQYIAREMEGLAVYFDFASVLHALRESQLTSSDLGGTQAALAFRRLVPVEQRSRYAPGLAPVQSRLLDDSALAAAAPTAPESATARDARFENQRTLHRAAVMFLEPLVEPMLAQVRAAGGRRRRQAIAVLGWLCHKKAMAVLREVAADAEDPDAPLACLLAAGHAGESGAGEILELVRRHAGNPSFAPMLLSLGAAPSAEALRMFGVLAASGPVEALPAAAAACEGFPAEDAEPLLERLCRDGHGWTTVNALESIGRLRSPRALELVMRTYRRLDHVTLRAAAAKVAGAIGGPEAVRFLSEILAGAPEPPVAARALEGLIRFSGATGEFATVFAAHTASQAPEAAVAAALGLAATDKPAAARVLRRWLLDTDPSWRAEAAYCLGYIPGGFSLEILQKVALSDPEESVRLQAVRSLALHERTPAWSAVLMRLLAHDDRQVRSVAIRLLGCPQMADDRDVYSCLAKTFQATADAGEAAALARAMGGLGSGLAREFLSGLLRTSDLDPERARGAADGLDLCGGGSATTVWKPLLDRPDPGLRGAAARALWHLGDDSGVAQLAESLGQGSPDCLLDDLETMVVSAVYLADEPRFGVLRGRLREALHSRSYQEFAAQEYSVHLSPDRLPPGFELPADSAGARPWSSREAVALSAGDLQVRLEQAQRRSRRRKRGQQLDVSGLDHRLSVLSPQRLATIALLALALILVGTGITRGGAQRLAQVTLTPARSRAGPAAAALHLRGLPGGASVELARGKQVQLLAGTAIRPGSVFQTGPTTACLLTGPGGSDRLRCFPGTSFTVASVSWDRAAASTRIDLERFRGELFAELEGAHTILNLRAENARVAVYRGQVLLRASGPELLLRVARGRAEVGGAGSETTVVQAGQEVEVNAGKPEAVAPSDPEAIARNGRR
jgi:HEAT repeat protein